MIYYVIFSDFIFRSPFGGINYCGRTLITFRLNRRRQEKKR